MQCEERFHHGGNDRALMGAASTIYRVAAIGAWRSIWNFGLKADLEQFMEGQSLFQIVSGEKGQVGRKGRFIPKHALAPW